MPDHGPDDRDLRSRPTELSSASAGGWPLERGCASGRGGRGAVPGPAQSHSQPGFRPRPGRAANGSSRWLLAAGGIGGKIVIWDLTRQIPRMRCLGSLYFVQALAFSPDGTVLASGGRMPLMLWDTASGPPAASPRGRRPSSLPGIFGRRATLARNSVPRGSSL